MRNDQTLEAWRNSMPLVEDIYGMSKEFPTKERYGLHPISRAAVSVPANIAEEMGRQYKRDTLQFLHITRGSACELDTLLRIACSLQFLSDNAYDKLRSLLDDIGRLLNGLINYVQKAALK